MEDVKIGILIFGIVLGIIIASLVMFMFGQLKTKVSDLIISNDTAYDICYQFTNNTNVVAEEDSGKLLCQIQNFTFDHTLNIEIKAENK
jgi:hypothetical protein